MPQSDNQSETNVQAPDTADVALDAALEKAGVSVEQKAIQDAAAAEERAAAVAVAQVNAMQSETSAQRVEPDQEESLVSIMAQGREHLLQRMREHAAQTTARKRTYKPPPLTERQQAVLKEEQEAGRRARERHEEELASRPPPPVREKWDGTSTPVQRPGTLVPDPTKAAPSGFAAGSGQYSADA